MNYLLLLFFLPISYKQNIINKENLILNGIYRIFSKSNNFYFTIRNDKLILSDKQSNFRFVPIINNTYYIEYKTTNKRLGITENDKFKLYNKKKGINNKRMFWNIIKIFKNEYLIRNNFNKKYIYAYDCILQFSKIIYKENLLKKNKTYIFNILKLCEESKKDNKYLKFIKKEPIDAIIKYIDLTDKTLNRTGIKQIYKDIDNEELRYSIRSILKYIPWIRKIYILMPNDKVRFFKDKVNIKEKIIYIKDKDFLGFDSANIFAFTFNLFKLEKFGISKNFIYMEDDFFIGNTLNKFDFFYFDEKEKKIVPYLITHYFYEMNKTEVLDFYDNLYKNKERIHPHSLEGWWMSIYGTNKYFSEIYKNTPIITRFTHNAKGENIDDLKEIYDKIKQYKYINETLFSIERHILTLNQPHFVNLYQLNIKHKKVHSVNYKYILIENIKHDKLKSSLFVINTSGNHKPLKRQYKIQKKVMEQRFPNPTIYEIKNYINKKENNYLIDKYFIKLKLFIINIFIKLICNI